MMPVLVFQAGATRMCVYIAHHYMFHTVYTVLYNLRFWTTNGPLRLARH